jgi:carbon monoxide dehydrogenase subunit G
MKVERTTTVKAPPQRLYEVVMDPRRLGDWVTIHHKLEDAPRGALKEGSELVQCLKLAGTKFRVHWKVVENDPCKRVVWEGRGPVGSHARAVYQFNTSDGNSTVFSYENEYDLPGGPLGRLAGRTVSRVTAKELDGSLQRLKALVE